MGIIHHILELDRDWSNLLRVAEKPGLRRLLAVFFAHSGDSWFWALGMLILWLAGEVFWRRWAIYQVFWIAILIILVMSLKFTIRRQRPAGEWGAIYRNTDPHSFPSGHAARSFLIATLGILLGPGWLAVILLVWAPVVALARVAMGVHYVSDIVAGAVIGTLTALIGWQLSPVIFPQISQLLASLIGISLW